MIVRSFRSLADAAEADVVADDVCKNSLVQVLHGKNSFHVVASL